MAKYRDVEAEMMETATLVSDNEINSIASGKGAWDGKEIRIDESSEELRLGAQRCGLFKRFGDRMRARRAECIKRRAEMRKGCDNEPCIRKMNRKRKIRRFIFGLLGLVLFFHLAKGAYMLWSLPKNVHCSPITSDSVDLSIPSRSNFFIDHSLTQATTTILHSDEQAEGTFGVHVEFEGVEDLFKRDDGDDDGDDDEDKKDIICSAVFGHGVFIGAWGKKHSPLTPKVLSTIITLPTNATDPNIRFVNHKHHCGGKFVRKIMKWKRKHGGH